jgi:hypothetical protein
MLPQLPLPNLLNDSSYKRARTARDETTRSKAAPEATVFNSAVGESGAAAHKAVLNKKKGAPQGEVRVQQRRPKLIQQEKRHPASSRLLPNTTNGHHQGIFGNAIAVVSKHQAVPAFVALARKSSPILLNSE